MTMPKAMTLEEMEADAKAAEEAAKAESTATSEPQASDGVQADAPETRETPAPQNDRADDSAELQSLKAELADKQSKIDELTKRVRDEDGRRGGELSSLRSQVESLGSQLKDIVSENRELRKRLETPEVPPEPDPLEAEYPAVAEALGKRTKPLHDAVARAEETAKLTQTQLSELREARFFDSVIAAVPDLEKYNADPEFLEWCGQIPAGDDEPRQAKLNRYRASGNSRKAVELLGQWAESKNKKVTEVAPVDVQPKKEKPSKEAQVQVPASVAPSSFAKRDAVKERSRIAELESKIFKLGTATKEDREELESLYIEAEKRGELK